MDLEQTHIELAPPCRTCRRITRRGLEVARSRLTRTFTDDECVTYDIDPCRTFEAVGQG